MVSSWWSFLLYCEVILLTLTVLASLFLAFRDVISYPLRPSKPSISASNETGKLRPDIFWLKMSIIFFLLLAAIPSATIFIVNSVGESFTFAGGGADFGSVPASGWVFSKTVDVGGLATAAAAVGAATAYIIDLIRRRAADRKGRQRNAQAKVIIEILQRHWADGASEREIFRLLSSRDDDAEKIRQAHGARRLGEDPATYRKMESQLLSLVYEGLIRISAPDHYRLRDAPQTRWDIDSARRQELRTALKDQLTGAIWDHLKAHHPSGYEMARLLNALDSLDEPLSAVKLLELKDAYPSDKQHEALEGLVDFLMAR